MIERQVVLVLGAGASKPYGLPLGSELHEMVLARHSACAKVLVNMGFQHAEYEAFCSELERALRQSVDAFLETRPDLLEVGKAAIAYHVARCENFAKLYEASHDEHWYAYLFNLMATRDFGDFAKNKISFVTFNYDRSLEVALLNALAANYQKSPDEAAEMLAGIPIIHLYGKLGELSEFDPEGRPYAPTDDPELLRKAMDSIRIISEGNNASEGEFDDPAFCEARDLIKASEFTIFLGFAYHRTNVKRLTIPGGAAVQGKYYGSTFGMTEGECILDIENALRIERVDRFRPVKALEFLREYVFLFKRTKLRPWQEP